MMFGNAEAYESFMGRWSRLAAERFVDFVDLPNGGKVLDVGSGTGALAFEVARRKAARHVTGIDPSKEFVAYAMSRNPFHDRIRFQLGSAQDLPFADAEFGSSVSLLVFNFIPDPVKALLQVRRVTQPGGSISASVWDYGGQMRMLRAFWDAAVELDPQARSVDEGNMPLCRPGALSELWKQAGLENVHEQALDFAMRFESFADYWDPFLLGQGPAGAYLLTLLGHRTQALRRAVKRQLSITSETDAFTLSARLWAVRGTVRSDLTEGTRPSRL